jgi:glycosyltransferase involved in cell wall biosynthesis
MRVIQVIDSLAPGGAERSLTELAPFLIGRGVELEVVVLHDRTGLVDEVRSAGATVIVLQGGSKAARVRNGVRLIRSRAPDLVHTTLFDADVIGRMSARLAGVPSVSSLVNTPYGPEHLREPGQSRARVRVAQLADMATAHLARRFRAVSVAVKEAYVDHLRLRPDLIEVIPEGRDPIRLGMRTSERRARARQTLGLGHGEQAVVAIGRQEPQKGFDCLIRALPELKRTVPGIRVFVAGRSGRSSGELSSLVRHLGLHDSVEFLGHRPDATNLLCAADVFVLPSIREGIPGVVQEAMALEAAIVASDIGPVREALGGVGLAELFRPGDVHGLAGAITRVLENPQMARERSRLARERFLAEFDIRRVADRILTFYQAAMADTSLQRSRGR